MVAPLYTTLALFLLPEKSDFEIYRNLTGGLPADVGMKSNLLIFLYKAFFIHLSLVAQI